MDQQLIEEILAMGNPSKDFSEENLGWEGATLIANNLPQTPNITSLNLQNNKIEDQGAIAIAEALEKTGITFLDLSQNEIGFKGATAIANVLKNTKIESLNLGKNKIGIEGATVLAEGLLDTQITNLNIQGNNIQDQGILAIANVLSRTRLTSLNVYDNKISPKGIADLAEALTNTKITNLYLGKNALRSSGAKAIARVLKNTEITNLDLAETEIKFGGLRAIVGAVKDSRISTLSLDRGLYGNAEYGINQLFRVLKHTRITTLNIANLYSKCPIYISSFLRDSQITTLNISNNDMITSDELTPFVHSFKYSKITSLDLSQIYMDDETAICLARELKRTRIIDLNLSVNEISRDGAIAIVEAVKDRRMTRLHLEDNHLGDEGATEVAQLLIDTQQITSLEFRRTRITDKGVMDIFNILKGTEITNINLTFNEITNEGVIEFAKLLKDTELTSLWFFMYKIKEDGYRAVAEALKDTYITFCDMEHYCGTFGRSQPLKDEVLSIMKNNRDKVDGIYRKFKNLVSNTTDSECNPFDYIELVQIILNKKPCFTKHFTSRKNNIYTEEEIKNFIQNIHTHLGEFLSTLKLSMIEHVKVLLMCEKNEFNVVVQRLLLNRPNYSLLQNEYDVLHPAVYVLMNKYGLPLYCEGMKPTRNDLIGIFETDRWDSLIKQNEISNEYGREKLLSILIDKERE